MCTETKIMSAREGSISMKLQEILKEAVERDASDIFFVVGRPVCYKIEGTIEQRDEERLMPADSQQLVGEIYASAGRDMGHFEETGDDDFSLSANAIGRFRVNVFRQRGACSAVLRVVHFSLEDYREMGIPEAVMDFAKLKKGLVLVTGSAGSGKSTTISYIIDRINETRNCHILTLEDPIEFLHRHKQSIVSQREIGIDSESYGKGLRAAMRESPDVILIGEMRDLETIETAMTAAETGHLVLSTLHTVGAANTIDRVIDVFPSGQQQQIRLQLSMVLQGIVSQQLLPAKDGQQVPAFEILRANSAIKTMIRDGKIHQIDSVIYSSAQEDMCAMDSSILRLYKEGRIEESVALTYASSPEGMRRSMAAIR